MGERSLRKASLRHLRHKRRVELLKLPGNRVADVDRNGKRIPFELRNAEVQRQVAGDIIRKGDAKALTARLHADVLREEMHRFAMVAGKPKAIESEQ